MNVNNIIKLLLLLLLFVNADAKLIGSIGFISPSYPDFGRYRPSQDVEDFFEDFMETAYDSYSDAGIAVMNRFNMKRGDIIFKDIKYKNRFLIPSEDNKDVIDDFYSRYKIRGNEFLQQIAKSNAVDTILFSSFNKTKLKRMIRSKKNPSILIYRIFAFDAQTGGKSLKYIKVPITDLFTLPDYDPENLQTLIIAKYIKSFQELFTKLRTTGSLYSEDSSSKTVDNNTSLKDTDSGDNW